MSYISAMEQAIAEKEEEAYSIRLAKVTSINSSGNPFVTFYGEDTASTKAYKHIAGYKPAVGDVVAMMRQAKTYVILGKVTDEFSAEGEYASKKSVDDIISGTTTVGKATNATNATGDKNGNDITTTYAAKSHSHSEIVNSSNANLMVYIDNAGAFQCKSKTYALDLGATNNPFDFLRCNKIYSTNKTSYYLDMSQSMNYRPCVVPSTSNAWDLGTSSYYFGNVYATQFYQNGTAISTSDKNKKNTISDLADKFKDFFKKLRPVTFKFNDAESGRLHAGFIAQEVEEAMHEADINNTEFAGLVIQEDGSYALRYEEFIAVQTAVIQDLIKRVEELEKRN